MAFQSIIAAAVFGVSVAFFLILMIGVDIKRINRMSQGITLWQVIQGRVDAYRVDGQMDPKIDAGFVIDRETGEIIPNGKLGRDTLRSFVK